MRSIIFYKKNHTITKTYKITGLDILVLFITMILCYFLIYSIYSSYYG